MAEDASTLVWKTCRSDRAVRGSRDEYDGIDGGNERLDRLGAVRNVGWRVAPSVSVLSLAVG